MQEIKFRFFCVAGMFDVIKINFEIGTVNLSDGDNRLIKNGHLMQFTGRKDKNGKPIYEGDIVKAKTYKEPFALRTEKKILSEVVYIPPAFHLKRKLPKGYRTYPRWCDGEIIGNIFENPELLKARGGFCGLPIDNNVDYVHEFFGGFGHLIHDSELGEVIDENKATEEAKKVLDEKKKQPNL